MIGQVKVPVLVMTAQDDPFVPYDVFLRARVAENPRVTICGAGARWALRVHFEMGGSGEVLGGGESGGVRAECELADQIRR